MGVEYSQKIKKDLTEFEIWKDIPGFQNIYQASSLGRVRSKDHMIKTNVVGKYAIKKGRILKLQISKKGYLQCTLMIKPCVKYNTGVHRLVAMAFIPNPNNYPQVNHMNGIKKDNHVSNLEWITNKDNQIHAINNGLTKPNVGEKHHNSKLTNKEVEYIRKAIKEGTIIKKLADQFKISSTALVNIKYNRTYINI